MPVVTRSRARAAAAATHPYKRVGFNLTHTKIKSAGLKRSQTIVPNLLPEYQSPMQLCNAGLGHNPLLSIACPQPQESNVMLALRNRCLQLQGGRPGRDYSLHLTIAAGLHILLKQKLQMHKDNNTMPPDLMGPSNFPFVYRYRKILAEASPDHVERHCLTLRVLASFNIYLPYLLATAVVEHNQPIIMNTLHHLGCELQVLPPLQNVPLNMLQLALTLTPHLFDELNPEHVASPIISDQTFEVLIEGGVCTTRVANALASHGYWDRLALLFQHGVAPDVRVANSLVDWNMLNFVKYLHQTYGLLPDAGAATLAQQRAYWPMLSYLKKHGVVPQ